MYRSRNPEPTAVSPREFIKAWQESDSVAEVAQKVRSKKNACRVRAFRYRQRGIPLKEIPTSPPAEPTDWDDLARYAASLLPEELEDDASATELAERPELDGAGPDDDGVVGVGAPSI